MKTVTVIGVGRVGGAMALSLPREKYSVTDLIFHSRADTGRFPGLDARRRVLEDRDAIETDIVFITVRDQEIAGVVEALKGKLKGRQSVFHTSGSRSSDILQPLKEASENETGSIHPLVSISRAEDGRERFQGAYMAVEGSPAAVELAKEICSDLGGKPFFIDTRFKTLYHAAAVTSCGHLVALVDASIEMLQNCGIESEMAKEVLLPLIASTVENIRDQDTASALTGTFARADTETFTRHIAALNENVSDDLVEIYLLLGERSLALAARGGASSERFESLRAKVAIAKSKLKW